VKVSTIRNEPLFSFLSVTCPVTRSIKMSCVTVSVFEWNQSDAGIGRAAQLRTFDSEAVARGDARRPGRNLGRVAADMWSIDPVPSRAIYAIVQEMPNGWWKGLVAGWSDLPEQYALSRERLLADLGQIAGEYASERLVRGIPIAASAPMTVKTWECVAIPFELPTAR